MEYSKDRWDLLLGPRSWHKRLNTLMVSLVPGVVVVGFFDLLAIPHSIFSDFLLKEGSGSFSKLIWFVLCAAVIGFLDVFIFAWPVADFCRYLAKRKEKFISPGFHIILMKSYAYSHILFLPVLLLFNPTGLQIENVDAGSPLIIRAIVFIVLILLYTQQYWQLGIMLRTVGVKSKIEFFGKLMIAAVMLLWAAFTGEAIYFLVRMVHQFFETLL